MLTNVNTIQCFSMGETRSRIDRVRGFVSAGACSGEHRGRAQDSSYSRPVEGDSPRGQQCWITANNGASCADSHREITFRLHSLHCRLQGSSTRPTGTRPLSSRSSANYSHRGTFGAQWIGGGASFLVGAI